MAPPVAGRSSQAASDSDAAARQQTQKNDIASSDPRLVKKGPILGLVFFIICIRLFPIACMRYRRGRPGGCSGGRPVANPVHSQNL